MRPAPAPLLQVIYSHAQAKALHHAPLAILLLLPLLSGSQGLGWATLLRSTLLALASLLATLAVPAALGAARALASGEPRRR